MRVESVWTGQPTKEALGMGSSVAPEEARTMLQALQGPVLFASAAGDWVRAGLQTWTDREAQQQQLRD